MPDHPVSRFTYRRGEHDVNLLYERLVKCYCNGNWDESLKVPHYPHCSHVVRPLLH
jgi:hypothetical protein